MFASWFGRGERIAPEGFLDRQDQFFHFKAKRARQLFRRLRPRVDAATATRATTFLITRTIAAHRVLKGTTVRTIGEEEELNSYLFPMPMISDPGEQRPKRPPQKEVTEHWEIEPFIDVARLMSAEESFGAVGSRWLYPFAAMNLLLLEKPALLRPRMGPRRSVLEWVGKREWRVVRDRSRIVTLAGARYGPLEQIPE